MKPATDPQPLSLPAQVVMVILCTSGLLLFSWLIGMAPP